MIKEYAKQMVSLLFLLSGIALSSSAQKQQVWKPFYDKCRREKSIIDAIPTELEKALHWSPTINKEQKAVIRYILWNMIYVEGNSINMGENNDVPVTVGSFFINRYEVSQDEWYVIMGNNPSNQHKRDFPVDQINWYDARRFTQRLSELSGLPFRLPFEAEWEYAARGGTETPYFFTGNPKDFSDQGFWRKFFDAKTDSIGSYVIYSKNSKNKTQEPDLVKANPFGLKNMLGNVMEYCADKYDPEAYAKSGSSATDPLVTEGTEWVVRGGNYTSDAADLRCASRDYTKHEAWLKTDPQQPKSIWWYSDIRGIGFRVVCEPNK